MKKLSLNTLLIFCFISAYSQSCLPEGIWFKTQSQIDSFQYNYPNCSVIEGDVWIRGESITDSNIVNLNGLNVINSIDGDLIIKYNSSLGDFIGLENLSYVGGNLTVVFNNSLKYFIGIDNLTIIGGNLRIENNNILLELSGMDNLTYIVGDCTIKHNLLTNFSGLEQLSVIGGDFTLGSFSVKEYTDTTLTSMKGLNNLTSIGGSFNIAGFKSLKNLHDLINLTSAGSLCITDNDGLTSLNGLDSLSSLGGGLSIGGNNSLISLKGIENITTVGYLVIGGYFILGHGWTDLGNASLTNLEGLNNLISAERIYIQGNEVLSNLSGLENLVLVKEINIGNDDWPPVGNYSLNNIEALRNIIPDSITSIVICYNESLSECETQNICEFINATQGAVIIHDNAQGCNSEEEVEEACSFSINDYPLLSNITIYPNPAHQELNIIVEGFTIDNVAIYTLTGQQVVITRSENSTINISHLRTGMYIVEVMVEGRKVRQKMLVQR